MSTSLTSSSSSSSAIVALPDAATTEASSGVWLDLIANDRDPDGDWLAISAINQVGTKGTVTLNRAAANGAWYSPGSAFDYLSAGETATDSFTYTVTDGNGDTATAVATVTITGVNQAPVAGDENASTDASHAVALSLLANATDVNRDDVLSVAALDTTSTKGSVTLGPGGVATYTPGTAFQYLAAGTTAIDTFGYTVADGHGGTATATASVTIAGTWQPPVAVADAAATDAKHAVTIDVLANDTDPQAGQTLHVAAVGLGGSKGTASVNADGTVTYDPGTAFLSLKAGATANDTFTYTVADRHGVTSTTDVTVTVTGVNTPPVANADTAATNAQQGVWLSLTANDTDVNGDTLSVISVDSTNTKGTVQLNPAATSGAYYSAGHAFDYLSVGQTATDTFSYTISDGQGGTATAVATVTVTGENQAPVAGPDSASTDAAHAVTLNLLAHASDVNRDDLVTVTGLDLSGTKGRVVLGAGGIATYTPGSAFTYLAAGTTATDSFNYVVCDNHGASATATATVTVVGTWLPPTAKAGTGYTDAKHAVTINVLAGATDPQPGQVLSVTGLDLTGTRGTVVRNANGTVTYNPGTAFLTMKAGALALDRFGYIVTDSHGVATESSVTVTVMGVNTPPVANPDAASTDALHGVWVNVTANDTDINGDVLSVIGFGLAGTKGSVMRNPGAPNGVYYSPGHAFDYLSLGETAIDTFTTTVWDGAGGTATATATITITGVNQAPVAGPTVAATDSAHAVSLALLGNAHDVNRDDTLSITAIDLTGTRGSVVLGANGAATYTPGPGLQYLAAGTTAQDSFSYTVADNHGATTTGTATVAVTGLWRPPVAVADSARTDAAHAVTIDVLANDAEPQAGTPLSVASLDLSGTNGSVVINADGTLTYTPGAAFATLAPGSATMDSFAYTVSDGHGGTSKATVLVRVTAPGAAPSAPQAFYVATDGNDAWSGRLAAPNAAGTDGPLATLQAAQARMAASPATKTTYVEGGDYYLKSTLTLGAADSGDSFLAYQGQTPVIHGGQQITGWVQGNDGIWTAQAPAGAFPQGGAAADLFLNGMRETHARYPNAVPGNPVQGGWLDAAASLPGENTTSSFQFNAGDIPNFASTDGLYVAVYQQNGWQDYTLPIASIDYANHTINLAGRTGMPIDQGSRYYIYNAASQLTAANSWFYDPATNTISLDAPAGFNGTGVTVGSLSNIVALNGANNVDVSGLTLTGSSSTGNGLLADGASGAVFAGDTISNVGTGINFAASGSNETVSGSVIENANNMGVLIYPGTNNVAITGNSIHDIGQLINGSAIWFTGSSNDLIAYNQIENVARYGVGGGSAIGASDASYNDVISYNQIGNTNQATSDGGAIYLGGMQQTLTHDTIAFNTIYGTSAAATGSTPQLTFLPAAQLPSFAVYLDDYASGVAVHDNLMYNNIAGVDVHSGWNNSIYYNVIANGSGPALSNVVANWRGTGAQQSTNNDFIGNLVSNSQPGASLSVNQGEPGSAQWTGNFYDQSGLSSTAFGSGAASGYRSQGLAGWQAQGYDTTAVVGASGLVASGAGFSLPTNSPALAIGVGAALTTPNGLAGYAATNPYDLFGH